MAVTISQSIFGYITCAERKPCAVRWAASDPTDWCKAVNAANFDWTQPTQVLELIASRSVAQDASCSSQKTRSLTACERNSRAPVANVSCSTVPFGESKFARFNWQMVFVPWIADGASSSVFTLTCLSLLVCWSERCTLPHNQSGSTACFRPARNQRIVFYAVDPVKCTGKMKRAKFEP